MKTGTILWIKPINENIWTLCEWYKETEVEGLLGTARVIAGPYKGIGYHKWADSNQEFEEFVIVNSPDESQKA